MTTTNDITGDRLISKANSKAFNTRRDWAFCGHPNHKPLITDSPGIYECPNCGMKTEVDIGYIKYGV